MPSSERQEDAEESSHTGNYPEAHSNFRFRPASCFEVMMNWSRDKDFAVKESLTRDLNKARASFNYKDDTNYREKKQCVCHHSNDAQARTKSKAADVTHEEASWINIEPQIAQQRTDHCKTKASE
jgi:hypothetical protein